MTMRSLSFDSAFDAPVEALAFALAQRGPIPERVLFLRARDGVAMRRFARANWLHEHTFKPAVDSLERSGFRTGAPDPAERFALVLMLPPRQRDEARGLFVRAIGLVAEHGMIMAGVANDQGARSAQDDLERLCGTVQILSKHKCRVIAVDRAQARIDSALLDEWRQCDAIRPIADGCFLSRPGLFAWDRIDNASALLAAHLPTTLAGKAADLGAGYGYLSHHLATHCPGITSIDLYEAEARALDPARDNLSRCGRSIPVAIVWHDVTTGIPTGYDVIVSNPPFHHQGRADQPDLGRAFIRAAANALNANGRFWLVANRHLPYESTLTECFTRVSTVADREGFKVIHAIGPRP